MKLRIRGDTVRLRLSQSETVQLSEQGAVSDAVEFAPDSRLEYRLEVGEVESPEARYASDRIVVTISKEAMGRWLDPTEVAIEAEQPLDPEHSLRVLIEKDFACLTPREGEDESDSFPNPQAGSG